MATARRRTLVALVCAAAVGSAAVTMPAPQAQVPPLVSTTTTTSAPPSGDGTTTTTSGSSGGDFSGGGEAPAGAEDPKGDGAAPPAGGIRVPPEAQSVIDAVARSGASDNSALLTMLAPLQDLGMTEAEAMRVGLGRFPIAGPARYSHDWLYPRYGPGFRFHLGTDVFATYGTPVRAPVDGVARTSNSGLGGLTVKVVMPDGTYFYLAHLSRLVDGFSDGMPVRTGDVVGYVGDSGNARGGSPHLHIGIYPRGGPPVDPKPILDQFIAEAEAMAPTIVDAYEAARPPVFDEPEKAPGRIRPLLSPGTLRVGPAGWRIEVLHLAGVSPRAGQRLLVDREATT